jgi:hypothetical protein
LSTFSLLSCFLILFTVAPLASAYIGPGSGISVIGSLLGLFATILLAVGAILFWPFRRMLKKRRLQEGLAGNEEAEGEDKDREERTTVETGAVEEKDAR